MTDRLTIVVVEEDRDRAIAAVDALKASDDCDVYVIGNVSGLARKIAAHEPDVVLIDIDNSNDPSPCLCPEPLVVWQKRPLRRACPLMWSMACRRSD